MFIYPTRKRIMLLHLSGKVIRTTADHPFYVQGKGWTSVAHLRAGDLLRAHDGQDVPVEAVTAGDEERFVYNLPLSQESPTPFFNRPIMGFVAGTPILTPSGPGPIEQLRPGDFIQIGPEVERHEAGPGFDRHEDDDLGDDEDPPQDCP